MSMLVYVKFIVLLLLSFFFFDVNAIHSDAIEKNAEKRIEKLYHRLNTLKKPSMVERIDWVSKQFLGKPYELGALGEGEQARFDQFPKYRTDAFDCETYVTTVLAIAFANSVESSKQCIKQLRYKKGLTDYIQRNHFTSLDWNKNNQQKGFITDITSSIKDRHHQKISKNAKALINKPSWYQHKTEKTIRLHSNSRSIQEERLRELKTEGQGLEISEAIIPYLPLDRLFNKKGQANHYLFNQIPNGAIIEIIRPNWNLKKQIGTCLNVSHLGFAIWSGKTLYFRQASTKEGKVIDVPLISYLKSTLQSPTIKGINVQTVKPVQFEKNQCLAL